MVFLQKSILQKKAIGKADRLLNIIDINPQNPSSSEIPKPCDACPSRFGYVLRD
jgi:hypothetical protein